MSIHNWKKEIFTIPNILSLLRLLLIPVYVGIYRNASAMPDYYLAGSILAVSCLTDMIDGKIARRFNMISTIGKVLDPLADKLTQFALTLCLSEKYPVMYLVLVLFVVKEVFQCIAGLVYLRKGKILPGALLAGKVCTTVLFLSLIVLVIYPNLSDGIVTVIAAIDTAFLAFSFLRYIFAYFGKNATLENLEE